MWPRAFLDDPGSSSTNDDDAANLTSGAYGGAPKSKRKGQAGILVKFFELSRDGAKLRMEWRKRKAGIFPAPSKDPNAPIVVLEELGSIMNRAVVAYKEALRLYLDEVDKATQNPSFVCGAHQNVGVTLMENNRCVEAKTYLLQAEAVSVQHRLHASQNHCALCENLCTVHSKLKDWTNAELYAGKAVAFDPGDGSLSLQGVGVSKLLHRQARHAYMLMMAGHWSRAVDTSTVVLEQSRGHNSIKRRAKMMLVRSVSTIEMAMHERDGDKLDEGESELIQCISTTRRAFGQHSMEVADLLELAAMFMGGVREDYGQAERYALQAVKSREHGLCEQLAEEKEQALLRSGGGKKKDEDKTLVPLTPLPYLKDPRMQGIMEESVGFLKNIHMKSFLTPWRFLIWKGT